MKEKDLVTIAIPAYKPTYLAEVIESVLSQDYTNFELVIVNDKSPYDLDSIVGRYNDSRIKYFVNETNLGKESIVLNWNRCLDYAKGTFFVLLCDDDIMHPSFVSEMVLLAEKHCNCNVFHSRVRLFDRKKNEGINVTHQWPVYESSSDFLQNTLKGKRHHTVSEFLYRTKHIKANGGYIVFPAGYYSDIASVLRFSENGGVCSSAKCLITFQKSNENISSRTDYNVEKAMAALLYYDWLVSNYSFDDIEARVEQRRDFDLCEYYMESSWKDSLKILSMVPSEIWNLKKKMALGIKRYIRT